MKLVIIIPMMIENYWRNYRWVVNDTIRSMTSQPLWRAVELWSMTIGWLIQWWNGGGIVRLNPSVNQYTIDNTYIRGELSQVTISPEFYLVLKIVQARKQNVMQCYESWRHERVVPTKVKRYNTIFVQWRYCELGHPHHLIVPHYR